MTDPEQRINLCIDGKGRRDYKQKKRCRTCLDLGPNLNCSKQPHYIRIVNKAMHRAVVTTGFVLRQIIWRTRTSALRFTFTDWTLWIRNTSAQPARRGHRGGWPRCPPGGSLCRHATVAPSAGSRVVIFRDRLGSASRQNNRLPIGETLST